MDAWYLDNLVCPLDHRSFTCKSNQLICENGHAYPVVEGIPVLLVEGINQTIPVANQSIQLSRGSAGEVDGLYLGSVGLSAEERAELAQLVKSARSPIDPVVSYLVGATNGIAYRHLIGSMRSYPIPRLRLPDGNGRVFLDVGCNWGRWCIAAAHKNYRAVGIDPSLGAVMAARRVCREMGLDALFIVGDARHLPLRTGAVDTVFSYSVLQHFSRYDAAAAVGEMGRVLKEAGTSFVQMPTKWGIRCLYHQLRRGFSEPRGFDVRYYRISELHSLFEANVGPTQISVDCYFGIGLQPSDWAMMSWVAKGAIAASEALRFLSRVFTPLTFLADSVYLTSRCEPRRIAARSSFELVQPKVGL